MSMIKIQLIRPEVPGDSPMMKQWQDNIAVLQRHAKKGRLEINLEEGFVRVPKDYRGIRDPGTAVMCSAHLDDNPGDLTPKELQSAADYVRTNIDKYSKADAMRDEWRKKYFRTSQFIRLAPFHIASTFYGAFRELDAAGKVDPIR